MVWVGGDKTHYTYTRTVSSAFMTMRPRRDGLATGRTKAEAHATRQARRRRTRRDMAILAVMVARSR